MVGTKTLYSRYSRRLREGNYSPVYLPLDKEVVPYVNKLSPRAQWILHCAKKSYRSRAVEDPLLFGTVDSLKQDLELRKIFPKKSSIRRRIVKYTD